MYGINSNPFQCSKKSFNIIYFVSTKWRMDIIQGNVFQKNQFSNFIPTERWKPILKKIWRRKKKEISLKFRSLVHLLFAFLWFVFLIENFSFLLSTSYFWSGHVDLEHVHVHHSNNGAIIPDPVFFGGITKPMDNSWDNFSWFS